MQQIQLNIMYDQWKWFITKVSQVKNTLMINRLIIQNLRKYKLNRTQNIKCHSTQNIHVNIPQ